MTTVHEQETFDFAPIIAPKQQAGETIQQRFEAFHLLNPWVMDALVRLTRDLVARGRSKVGIGMLFEVLRWQYQRATTDVASDFKLNNNYRSRYARAIVAAHPEWDGVFETRELKA